MAQNTETQSPSPTLELCELCRKTAAKYRCPACNIRTCSLPCVRLHKSELDCSGIAISTYKPLEHLDTCSLKEDFRFLENVENSLTRARIVRGDRFRWRSTFANSPRRPSRRRWKNNKHFMRGKHVESNTSVPVKSPSSKVTQVSEHNSSTI